MFIIDDGDILYPMTGMPDRWQNYIYAEFFRP